MTCLKIQTVLVKAYLFDRKPVTSRRIFPDSVSRQMALEYRNDVIVQEHDRVDVTSEYQQKVDSNRVAL